MIIEITERELYIIEDALHATSLDLRLVADKAYKYTTPIKRKKIYDDAYEIVKLRSKLLGQVK